MLRVVFVCACSMIAGPLAIAGHGRNTNKCGAPGYKLARTYVHNAELTAIAISIKPRDVTVQNLFALACQLRLDYQAAPKLSVTIFNDERAAKYTEVPTNASVEISKRSSPAAYLASYRLDRQKGVQTLTLAVNPHNPCDNDIEIDLNSQRVSIVSCAS